MRSIASRPVAAVPTTSMPSTYSNMWLKPSLTTGWSSTISTRTPIRNRGYSYPHDRDYGTYAPNKARVANPAMHAPLATSAPVSMRLLLVTDTMASTNGKVVKM